MLPKEHRLDRETFKTVLPRARRVRGGAVSAAVASIPGGEKRFAFVVPAKTAKKASARNKIKRRARHAVAKMIPACRPGTAAVLFFGKAAEGMSFGDLEREIIAVFRKAKVLYH